MVPGAVLRNTVPVFYTAAVDFVGLYRHKRWYEEFFVKKVKKKLVLSKKCIIFVVRKGNNSKNYG